MYFGFDSDLRGSSGCRIEDNIFECVAALNGAREQARIQSFCYGHIMVFRVDFRLFMASQKEIRRPSRKKMILLLVAAGLPLFGILFSLSSFELRFINPKTSQQTVSLVAL